MRYFSVKKPWETAIMFGLGIGWDKKPGFMNKKPCLIVTCLKWCIFIGPHE